MHRFLTAVTKLKVYFVLAVVLWSARLSVGTTEAAPPVHVSSATLNRQTYLPLINKTNITEGYSIVFVSRQIPPNGSVYLPAANDLPGVGGYSRFRVAAPGKLMLRDDDGNLRVLIDGSRPSPATLNLIDVNAPDVSYDGTTIVFAGLPAGNYSRNPQEGPGAWRLYSIKVDGTGLRQITTSDMNLDYSQFGGAGRYLSSYDDTDPAWLPDGRIVFSSSRWPAYAQYDGVRSTNLYVVNADGSNLHRITAERSGADRPLVDPLTGKIVYFRWWRNYRFPINSMTTVPGPNPGEYFQFNGLTAVRGDQLGGIYANDHNAWHAATINPDGTGLAMWAGTFRDDSNNFAYGGAFTPSGDLLTNFFPMMNLSEAGGFGGLRRLRRGPGLWTGIIGISYDTADPVVINPTSYGVNKGAYAAEPEVLPSGRLIFSWAPNIYQDYDLYIANADGRGLAKLYGNPGTTELRARLVRPRPLPPILPDQVTRVASLLPPPPGATRYDQDGNFTFAALNIYANAPIDTQIIGAPPVGSGAKLRFFVDHQRVSDGSFPFKDWPLLFAELPINADGSVTNSAMPANLPLFEQVRSADNTIPFVGSPDRNNGHNDAAHVAGLNFGRPGEVVRCVGCHAGHSMIPVPANDVDAKFSNLAPGGQVYVSSTRDPATNSGLIDRKVMLGPIWQYWTSAPGQPVNGQWAQVTFPVPVTVRKVRLYNPRFGDEANSSLQVQSATVVLYGGANGMTEVGRQNVGALSVSGTDVAFPDVRALSVRVYINSITGTFYGMSVAGLAEIEVIARGESW